MITFTINGTEFKAEEGTTVLEVARRNNIEIPALCHYDGLEPYGACRLCVVEARYGGRTKIVTSCNYEVWEGVEIVTDSDRIRQNRKLTLELLLSRAPGSEKLQELAREYGADVPRFKSKDDDCILCGLCVRICQEKMGVGAASYVDRGADVRIDTPYHRGSDVCLTCGACVSVCPTNSKRLDNVFPQKPELRLSNFDEGLELRPSVYIPFLQAYPKVPVIDRTNCVHFLTGACGTCREACPAGAIDYEQNDEIIDIDAGAVILLDGADVFDPSEKNEYGYTSCPDVLNSIQFERMMSSSGPYGGHIHRLSDGRDPEKIAWIQCVGSRDMNDGNDYCSSVCCMYATKEAVIAREHLSDDLDMAIFYMDIRAYGKEFDRYIERAKNEYGVRFIKGRVSDIEQGDSGPVTLTYSNDSGGVETELFDMVVLSSGFRPSKENTELNRKSGVRMQHNGFVRTHDFTPVDTTRKGIFAAGTVSAPKDIPETVMEASAAAARAGEFLSVSRGTEISKEPPAKLRDITGEPIRVGVFACHCGINIGGVVDIPEVVEYIKTLDNVVYTAENMYTCSQDTQEMMKEKILEHGINRVVVASCSPRTHEPLFQETLKEVGLNPNLFELANIRDQNSWVHMKQPDKATQKAKDLVRMSVAKVRKKEAVESIPVDITKKLLVIGGGVAGMTAALSAANQGIEVFLVERESALGGIARDIRTTISGSDAAGFITGLTDSVTEHENITVYLDSQVSDSTGFLGNYISTISGKGNTAEVEHGAVIIATGGVESKPESFNYSDDERIMTQKELEVFMHTGGDLSGATAMIQCVGSRDEDHQYCSRVCCSSAVKHAIQIKQADPANEVVIFYRDMRTYGLNEEYYRKARELGVLFIRYEQDLPPALTGNNGSLELTFKDLILDRSVEMKFDRLILSSRIDPDPSNPDMAKMFKLPLTSDGFFLEAHMKLRPVDFATDGVFMAGLCHLPKHINETVAQAYAAAGRAMTILSKDRMLVPGTISVVNEQLCSACGTCESICPYSAIRVVEEERRGKTYRFARVTPALCKGCGACASACWANAVDLKGFTNSGIFSAVEEF